LAAKGSILLVDDMPANLHQLIEALLSEEYNVFVAENGWRALERVQQVQPDIILLDVFMPELDGFETCTKLKSNPSTKDIPVLFCSALDESINRVRGFEIGAVDYVTKPMQVGEVVARIRTHLTLRNQQQTLEKRNRQLEECMQERIGQLRTEIVQRQRQEEQKHKLLDVLAQQGDQLSALTTWLVANRQRQQKGQNGQVISRLTERLQHIFHQLEVAEAIVMALSNTTDRYQIENQLNQLHDELEQFKTDLQATSESWQEQTAVGKKSDEPLNKLSAREREVLQLVVDGNSNARIAKLLYLTETTVRSHRSRILHKLQLTDTTALIKFALQYNLTTL